MTTEITIQPNDEVWTSDEVKLGVARSAFFRPEEEVNPADLLFAVYLKVEDFTLGEDFFVPTDYIAYREDDGRVILDASMKEVLQRTWSRAPEFAAKRLGRREPLPYVERLSPLARQ